MHLLVGFSGTVLLVIVLWDAFETIILPRRASGRFRLTRLFYRSTWRPWRAIARRLPGRRQQAFLSFYGPLSLLMLLGFWAASCVAAFSALQWAAGPRLSSGGVPPGIGTVVYMSGTTFFTLGLGDVVPISTTARFLTVIEAGTGFAFLAIVIGYLPVIYQAFSRREVATSLLDARAGSPPTAGELLWRYRDDEHQEALRALLQEWEHWSADVLESHLSYPALAYFRSQHANQSWLASLTTILDSSAFMVASLDGACLRQARLTFAMARHAVVDLAQVFTHAPDQPASERLPAQELDRLVHRLTDGGWRLHTQSLGDRLAELRHLYDPYVSALAGHLDLPLPPWVRTVERRDNWQTSAWDPPRPRPASPPGTASDPRPETHF